MTEEEGEQVRAGAVAVNELIDQLKGSPEGCQALVMVLQAKLETAVEVLGGEYRRSIESTEELDGHVQEALGGLKAIAETADPVAIESATRTVATCQGRQFEMRRQSNILGALLASLTRVEVPDE